MMDERVIEAAARALEDTYDAAIWGAYETRKSLAIQAAIRAADAARAEQGFMLVRQGDVRLILEDVRMADRYLMGGLERAAYDRLTAALGDGAQGTEEE